MSTEVLEIARMDKLQQHQAELQEREDALTAEAVVSIINTVVQEDVLNLVTTEIR